MSDNANLQPKEKSNNGKRDTTNGKRRNTKNNNSNNQSGERDSNGEPSTRAKRAAPRNQSQPPEDGPSIQELRRALRDVDTKNASETRPVALSNTIANIERRIDALTRSRAFTATTVGMRADDLTAALTGLQVPCSTPQECLETIKSVLSGSKLMPKRVGWLTSAVFQATAENIVKLTTSSGFVAGMQIYVVAPTHVAHRGLYVMGVDPAEPVDSLARWHVIAYVPPNRDVEDVGSAVVDLYNRLSVSLPSLVAGTTTAIVSQILLQMAVTTVSPLAAKPGKLSYISVNRRAKTVPIGPESHDSAYFTAAVNKEDLILQDSFDRPNSAIVEFPQSSIVPSSPQAMPTVTANYFVGATSGDDANGMTAQGFSSAVVGAAGSGLISVTSAAPVTLWEWRKSQEYTRHLIYGGMKFGAFVSIVGSIIAADGEVKLIASFLYVQGGALPDITVVKQVTASFFGGYANQVILSVDTTADPAFDSVRGLLLKNISLEAEANSNGAITVELHTDSSEPIGVALSALAVPARATYNVASISNCLVDGSLSASLEVHSEVKVDQAAYNSKFLELDKSTVASDEYLPIIIQNMQSGNVEMYEDEGSALSASSWKKMLGKAARKIGHGVVQTARGIANGQSPVEAGIAAIHGRTGELNYPPEHTRPRLSASNPDAGFPERPQQAVSVIGPAWRTAVAELFDTLTTFPTARAGAIYRSDVLSYRDLLQEVTMALMNFEYTSVAPLLCYPRRNSAEAAHVMRWFRFPFTRCGTNQQVQHRIKRNLLVATMYFHEVCTRLSGSEGLLTYETGYPTYGTTNCPFVTPYAPGYRTERDPISLTDMSLRVMQGIVPRNTADVFVGTSRADGMYYPAVANNQNQVLFELRPPSSSRDAVVDPLLAQVGICFLGTMSDIEGNSGSLAILLAGLVSLGLLRKPTFQVAFSGAVQVVNDCADLIFDPNFYFVVGPVGSEDEKIAACNTVGIPLIGFFPGKADEFASRLALVWDMGIYARDTNTVVVFPLRRSHEFSDYVRNIAMF